MQEGITQLQGHKAHRMRNEITVWVSGTDIRMWDSEAGGDTAGWEQRRGGWGFLQVQRRRDDPAESWQRAKGRGRKSEWIKGRMISTCDLREGRGRARRRTKSQKIPKPAEESPGFRRPCSTGGGKGDGVGGTRVTTKGWLPWWSSGEDSKLSAAGGAGSIPGGRTNIPTCRVVEPK